MFQKAANYVMKGYLSHAKTPQMVNGLTDVMFLSFSFHLSFWVSSSVSAYVIRSGKRNVETEEYFHLGL